MAITPKTPDLKNPTNGVIDANGNNAPAGGESYKGNINAEFVERFQIEYQKDPRSRVFAALAEAYRKMGLLTEAHRICLRGIQMHPGFSGGRVAFAKILIDMQQPEKALEQLESAVATSPENLLAHSLLGETLLTLRRPKEALAAYKMVLFLNPNDEKAKAAVGKWEFLSADEYEDELFAMAPVFNLPLNVKSEEDAPILSPVAPTQSTIRMPISAGTPQSAIQRSLERAVSLADAFTVRGDIERALAVLQEARNRVGTNDEVDRRFRLLSKRMGTLPPEEDVKAARVSQNYGVNVEGKKSKISRDRLETLLRRIEARRIGG